MQAALDNTREHVFNQSTHLSNWKGLLAADAGGIGVVLVD